MTLYLKNVNQGTQYYGKGGEHVTVLKDVKEALGLIPDDTSFDSELKLHINAALSTLYQVGVGQPFHIEDNEDWTGLLVNTQNQNDYMLSQIKQYVYLKTKVLFDPPPPSSVEYVDGAANEMLWRIRENYNNVENGVMDNG